MKLAHRSYRPGQDSASPTPTDKGQSFETPSGLRWRTLNHQSGSAPVPVPHRRCCTLPIIDLVRTATPDSTSNIMRNSYTTRTVNLFDLIDEEFVVNQCVSSATPKSPVRRCKRRTNILDMMDRIVADPEGGDGYKCNNSGSSSISHNFMTERSYPRGVFVVPPTSEWYLSVGNVGFVAAEAFTRWNE
jgi:hypothetical protein